MLCYVCMFRQQTIQMFSLQCKKRDFRIFGSDRSSSKTVSVFLSSCLKLSIFLFTNLTLITISHWRSSLKFFVLLCCVVQRFILRKLPPFFARNQNFPLKPDKMSGHSFSKKSMTIISTRKVHTYRSVASSKFMWRAVSILLSKIQPRGPV